MDRFHASKLGKLKQKLQFTGWLQYIIAGALAVFIGLLAAVIGLVFGAGWLFWGVVGAVGLVLAITVFDLVTIKLGLHPREAIPKPLDGLDAFDLMRARRACRSFQRRKLLPEHLQAVLADAAHFSSPPQQMGDRALRFEYINAPLTVWPVVGCAEFLVAITPKAYNRLAVIDVGRSLQKVVHNATAQGLATCWIGPGADQASVIAHLGARFNPEQDHVICVCAIGYASFYKPFSLRIMGLAQHKRLPLEKLFFADEALSRPLDTANSPYGRCFEVCQWAPSSFNSQTTRGVAAADGRMDFYAVTASRYYAAVALGIWCANWELGCEALGKKGHFEVLHPTTPMPELPRYDVSWQLEDAQ